MQTKIDRHTLCVLVARLQVPSLSDAHRELIETALANHPRVLIVLGLSPTLGTLNNPLPYQPRRQMVLEAFPPARFPQLSVAYLTDIPSDRAWSEKLDEIIAVHLGPHDTACLYGGRASFIPHYVTKTYPTYELTSSRYVSGTELRKQVSNVSQSSPDFRAGVIWAAFQRYPTVFPTVDVVPFDADDKRILLARKPHETLYRFAGGFANPSDDSFEASALRELKEESGLDVFEEDLHYVGSVRVDDWRYRNEVDRIITHLYIAEVMDTEASAADDVAEVRWFRWDEVSDAILVEEHRPLWAKARPFLMKRYKLRSPAGQLTIVEA